MGEGGMAPELAFAVIGVLGVGAQWLAWRLRMPAIVLMLAAGLVVGPGFGLMVPSRDIGPLVEPMVSVAVAIILFEGGLTLNFHALRGVASGVRRLVLVGAPLGWLLSALALHYVAGLGWAAASVFGGIMIVTGPTVIAPLLRQARLSRRPSVLLQWEAIVNDPIGALAAVAAYHVVVAGGPSSGDLLPLAVSVALSGLIGVFAGWILAQAFRRGLVPEYMKVPVLFVAVLATFTSADLNAHESGLLAVTLMGIVIANADLPSFTELRRFKEHATILLVSGVFILLAADMDLGTLALLDLRAVAFLVLVILVVRPATVLLSLLASDVPWKERILVAFTGPRGVVLVAVAGFFAAKLSALGLADGAKIVPLAFALVAVTVILHGFTLAPLARLLGLAGTETPGLLIVGGSRFSTALGEACQGLDIPVLVTDRDFARLRRAREAGLPTYYGDILAEAVKTGLELVRYRTILAASDNEAYNTLVGTDMAPEFGRDDVFQLSRAKESSRRHALPSTLGARTLGQGSGYHDIDQLMIDGWHVKATGLTEEFGLEAWRAANPQAVLLARFDGARLRLMQDDEEFRAAPGMHLLALAPPQGTTGGH